MNKYLKVNIKKMDKIDIIRTISPGGFIHFTEIDLPTPEELSAVIALITLNESDNIYANPLLGTAKRKLQKLNT